MHILVSYLGMRNETWLSLEGNTKWPSPVHDFRLVLQLFHRAVEQVVSGDVSQEQASDPSVII